MNMIKDISGQILATSQPGRVRWPHTTWAPKWWFSKGILIDCAEEFVSPDVAYKNSLKRAASSRWQ